MKVEKINNQIVITLDIESAEDLRCDLDTLEECSSNVMVLGHKLNDVLNNEPIPEIQLQVSESTKRILKEIAESSEGWHTSVILTQEELDLFEKEIPDKYILEITPEHTYFGYDFECYIILGTAWWDDFGKDIFKNETVLVIGGME